MPKVKEDRKYNKDYIEESQENDEVEELEEGFIKGYDEENSDLCNNCHKVLTGYDDILEVEVNNKLYKFCSERCANKFERKNRK